ncbi:MAG: protein-L-isoaspartate(D-aspartate) O-methyltransferase [Rhodospirillales bacterium]|nr:protein-L-isoaspartate(D-aspartate) O-methyltransferase [Alphaproteobacteria bacterium]MCB9986016.1 protein-L-isoaspartate(D-aspartate) O-methyltransferase [Rhodospirillales bacterium]USO07409.1 MAG: protein-L-isoaspartate(D-aspartate) O-methyltransferase [Rhodospirillales bacterium]
MNALQANKIRLIMHLRRHGIADTQVLAAIERVPREEFVPELFFDQAYEDRALPIGLGQTISQPLVVATMSQALELNDRMKVLEIGTGSGYQAAILSRLVRRVYSMERHKPLLDIAEQRFRAMNIRNITCVVGDGMKGWPVQAPFDRIIVTAGAHGQAPNDLLFQLSIGGIMVVPVGPDGTAQTLVKYTRVSDTEFTSQELMPVRFVPLLPDVAAESMDLEPDINKLLAWA